MLVLQFYSLNFSMLDVDYFYFVYLELKSCYCKLYRSKTKQTGCVKKVLYSAFNRNILSVKTARIVFRFALSDIIKITELS